MPPTPSWCASPAPSRSNQLGGAPYQKKEDADGASIGVTDLICMMLQIGVSDVALQRELGAIKNPTLPAFNDKIEGNEQARKSTASGTAYGKAASKGGSQRRSSTGPPKANSRSTASRGRSERDRRLTLHGRCFCCAKEDHLLPQCSYPENVKCNL